MTKRIARTLLALTTAVALLVPAAVFARDVSPPSPPADGELALVVDVIDGDTIRVERSDGSVERVRYIGIDTPEIGHAHDVPDEPFGRAATGVNEDLVADEIVLLERDISDRDPYDRLLRYVWAEDDAGWLMVNAELVALGLADVHAYEPDTRHHEWFEQLRLDAIEAGVGMYDTMPEAEPESRDLLEIIADLVGWD